MYGTSYCIYTADGGARPLGFSAVLLLLARIYGSAGSLKSPHVPVLPTYSHESATLEFATEARMAAGNGRDGERAKISWS
jgi:hypothetical protein